MYEFLQYRVDDVMTREPVTISPDASLADAEEQFERYDFNALPVVGEAQRLFGVVTKFDMLRAFRFTEKEIVPAYERIMASPVRDVMTAGVECVEPKMPLTKVLERMVATRCKSFPVQEDGKLVGVIAREDILRALKLAVRGTAAGVRDGESSSQRSKA